MKVTPTTPLEAFLRPNPLQKAGLKRLRIETVKDLLHHLPTRYEIPGQAKNITDLVAGEQAVIGGKVISAETKKGFRSKIPMAEAVIEDQTGRIKAVWFHQAYMAKKIPVGRFGEFRGKVTDRDGELYIANPDVREVTVWQAQKNSLFSEKTASSSFLIPIYSETKGLSSGWFYYHIQQFLKPEILGVLTDPIPGEILKTYHLPNLQTALLWAHAPKKEEHYQAAQKRFAFEEIFYLQIKRLTDKRQYQENPSFHISVSNHHINDFINRFPFKPTAAQQAAITQIVADLGAHKPMTRLLEGDVGSGKTAVAATVAYAAIMAGKEVAYMAPTEILAKQHFESFTQYFGHLGINIGLITGKECRKFPSKVDPSGYTKISKAQLVKWIAKGEVPIVVGTHALIQKNVKFKRLALAIIDEQHRFGVMQRAKLTRKEASNHKTPDEKRAIRLGTQKDEQIKTPVPHLLSMTATPIPRTLALTVYGDLDLTVLDQMPSGRKPIITEIITPNKRDEVYNKIREALTAGRQAYVICPRIDEPDPEKEQALIAKSAKAEAKRLAEKVFPGIKIGLLHSKMKPADKEEEMERFSDGETKILVATSVVEVGVNVPNATSIIIEGAERFGLAQLHQLRGRVIRSNHQAYCYLFTETNSAKSLDRLKALVTAKNGFELAELDLALRGAGLLSGEKQWGISDLGMEAIRNIKMVEAARTEARRVLEADPDLADHPTIKQKIDERPSEIHFE